MAKRVVPMVSFTMLLIPYAGAEPRAEFAFEAKDEADAESKAKNWCHRHHNRQFGTDVKVRRSNEREQSWPKENSWVR